MSVRPGGPPSPLSVAVVGAGTLGTTVAHAALAAGLPTRLVVRGGTDRAARACSDLVASLRREAAAGRMTAPQVAGCLSRLTIVGDLAAVSDVDIVIESIHENLADKQALLARLEAVVSPTCAILSTTSTIPAADLGRGAAHPERVAVAHYIWPAHRMPVVEVAYGSPPSRALRAAVDGLLNSQHKQQLVVLDRPGFFLTRGLFAYWDATLSLLRDGVSAADIDAELEAFGWPMGPCRLLDATGIDSVGTIHRQLTAAVGDLYPSLGRLSRLVDAGLAGLYRREGKFRTPDPLAAALLREPGSSASSDDVVARTMGALGAEVARAVDGGAVGSWEDAGFGIDAAFGFPCARGGFARWWAASDRPPVVPVPRSAERHDNPVVSIRGGASAWASRS